MKITGALARNIGLKTRMCRTIQHIMESCSTWLVLKMQILQKKVFQWNTPLM